VTHTLESVLRFGKYSGLSVRAILRFDPRYIGWLRANLDGGFPLDDDAKEAWVKAEREDRQQSMNRQEGWAWGFGAAVKSAAQSSMRHKIKVEHEERRKAGQALGDDLKWRRA
jgi:hypothetical protein